MIFKSGRGVFSLVGISLLHLVFNSRLGRVSFLLIFVFVPLAFCFCLVRYGSKIRKLAVKVESITVQVTAVKLTKDSYLR